MTALLARGYVPSSRKVQERHHQEYEEADYDIHPSLTDDLRSHNVLALCDSVLWLHGECRADPQSSARNGRLRPVIYVVPICVVPICALKVTPFVALFSDALQLSAAVAAIPRGGLGIQCADLVCVIDLLPSLCVSSSPLATHCAALRFQLLLLT